MRPGFSFESRAVTRVKSAGGHYLGAVAGNHPLAGARAQADAKPPWVTGWDVEQGAKQ